MWFGLNWSLELYQQAIARLYRQGQKDTVFIHILAIDESRDIDVINVLDGKDVKQEALIESLKARIKMIKEANK